MNKLNRNVYFDRFRNKAGRPAWKVVVMRKGVAIYGGYHETVEQARTVAIELRARYQIIDPGEMHRKRKRSYHTKNKYCYYSSIRFKRGRKPWNVHLNRNRKRINAGWFWTVEEARVAAAELIKEYPPGPTGHRARKLKNE